MSEAVGVVDASPLIALAEIAQLELLPRLFASVIVPPAVIAETTTSVGQPAWFVIVPPVPPLDHRVRVASLGAGETETIGLGLQLGDVEVVLDDRPARRLAIRMGLAVVGTLGLLLRAKWHGILDAVRPHLLALRSSEFYPDSRIIEQALADVGESLEGIETV
ncbi:MAG: DUF3368 domain-containing protein [Thermomicrobiales bacterium]